MIDEISTKQFLSRFKKMVKALGGPEAAAKNFSGKGWECSATYIRGVMNATALPSKILCERIYLEPLKEIKYRYRVLK